MLHAVGTTITTTARTITYATTRSYNILYCKYTISSDPAIM